MESRRMALIALLGVIAYLLYQAWVKDYPSVPPAAPTASATVVDHGNTPPSLAAAPSEVASAGLGTSNSEARRIHVVTDVMVADISTAGAELRRVQLERYPIEKSHPDIKLALVDDRDGNLLTLQSGLAAVGKQLAETDATYSTAQANYALASGAETLDVPFEFTDALGNIERKVYHFRRGSYEIGLEQSLTNHSGSNLQIAPYARWRRGPIDEKEKQLFARSFFGMGVYEQKKGADDYRFRKFKLDEIRKEGYESTQTGGWLAMLQHYFVAAVIPPTQEHVTLSAKAGPGEGIVAQMVGNTVDVPNGADARFTTQIYVGPKEQGKLDAIAKGLELTEDYGILTPIAKPLFSVLAFFHRLTGNWGWSIILLTLLVKALFYPLSAAQYRSMAKMKKFTPRIAEIKERYADDREKLNKAMMDLYKKEGFNPLAGCWPVVVQMPVFFALYWVLNESVELRQAPFIFWITDLSAKDPYYIVPLLYGVSMWLQQRISGQTATMDPTQAKVMNVMPIAFTGMFLFFPSGLVIYYFLSNMIGILQQRLIIWQTDRAEARARQAAA